MNATTLSPEIQELRKSHVGASEVAALFGLHPHLTAFELWHRKAGKLPEDDLSGNSRVEAGIFMESGIAAWVKHRTGWPIEKVTRYCQHPTVPGMGASPDYEYRDPESGELVTVQVKNVDALVFRDWQGVAPMMYQLQVQHEIACGPYDRGVLAVCYGGNELELFHFDRHAPSIAKLEAAVVEFWRSIDAGEAPDPDFGRDLETLQSLYSATEAGKVVDLTGDPAFADACSRYIAAGAAAKAAEEAKDAAKAEILTYLQDASVAVADGFKVSSSNVEEKEITYTRKAYRTFRCTDLSADRPKKGRK